MIKLMILGQPYVKKSNQKVVYNRALGRQIKVNTPAYNAWADSARLQLREQRGVLPPEPIDYPINLQCRFYVRTNGRVDLSALYEGIQDMLVSMDVLKDDSWQYVASHDGSGVEIDRDNPRLEVTITAKEEQYER